MTYIFCGTENSNLAVHHSSVKKSLSSWREKTPVAQVLVDDTIRAIARTHARQAVHRASGDVVGNTLARNLCAAVNKILQTGAHYKYEMAKGYN